MTKTVNIQIQCVPDYASNYAWWVARYSAGFLWFYGAFSDENRALDVANEVDGMVVTVDE